MTTKTHVAHTQLAEWSEQLEASVGAREGSDSLDIGGSESQRNSQRGYHVFAGWTNE